MAQKVSITLVDDIDGTEAAETVTFGLDGRTYELDLNEKNAKKLRSALDGYTKAARMVRSGSVRVKARSNGQDNKAIREWAAANGVEVAPTGRIPKSVVDQYAAMTR